MEVARKAQTLGGPPLCAEDAREQAEPQPHVAMLMCRSCQFSCQLAGSGCHQMLQLVHGDVRVPRGTDCVQSRCQNLFVEPFGVPV